MWPHRVELMKNCAPPLPVPHLICTPENNLIAIVTMHLRIIAVAQQRL